MARPKKTTEEQIAEVAEHEPMNESNGAVAIKTSIVSFCYDGVSYIAKNGVITIPKEALEVFNSHG